MAPDDDPDVSNNDTTYNGYFRASANGKTMIQDNFQEVFDGNHQY